MISDKIKALFKFIEFLHSNIDIFNSYNNLISELELLKIEKQQLKRLNNYKDKLKYDELQLKLEKKFKILQDNTANLIISKATELQICDINKTESIWNWNINDVMKLKENFDEKDVSAILMHKDKYIQYRTNTHPTFLSMQFFFNGFDDLTKQLFDFFKEDENINEYKEFERKEIQVNSIEELITAMKYGVNSYVPLDSNFNPTQTNDNIHSENTFLNAKQRIDKRPASEAKSFALSIYFENISTFIDYYTNEAKASDKGLGQKADLFLNKCKNRLEDCDTENELTNLLNDCVKGKGEMFNIINNSYENQYKKEFNFFSFNESTSFDWQDKHDAITHIKYYLEYKYLINAVNDKLSVMKKKRVIWLHS